MKLQAKLLILFTLCTIFILATLGSLIYWKLWDQNLRLIQAKVSNDLHHIDFSLNTFFEQLEFDIDWLVTNEKIRVRDDYPFTSFLNADEGTFTYRIGKSEQEIIDVFDNYRLTHHNINSVFMGRENGSYVRSPKRDRPTHYDPRERPWYILTKRNPNTVIKTDAYASIAAPVIHVVMARALTDTNGVMYGAVGLNVTMVQLTNYIDQLRDNPLVKYLLVNENDVILAGLTKNLLFKNIREYSPVLQEIFSELTPGFVPAVIQGRKYYVSFINATRHSLKIAALIPANQIERRVINYIVIAGMGLVIGVVLLSVLTMIGLRLYVVKPLQVFTDTTNDIARTSDLERRIDISSRDEIGIMANSYNQMMDALSSTEAELRRSEKQYRDIFNNAVMGIYQSTPDGRWRGVNPAMASIFGFETPDEMISSVKDIREELYVNPEDRDRFTRLFEERGIVRGFEAEFKRRDGSRFWISIHGKAIRDEEGKILWYNGTVEDITDRKEAQQELAIYREHLETQVKERTMELEIAKEQAESADRLKSAFLATMSHELRTPLNSIIGFTGIILQEIVGPLSDEQRKQLTMVKNSAQHLLVLINDVLDISKIEAGQLEIVCEPYDLRRSIEETVGSARPIAEKKGIDLICTIASDNGTIRGDRRRVEQVLLNLLSNAIKFTEKGSVTVKYEGDGDTVTIRVVDTGIGIREENQETIFQPFRQIDSGLNREYEGTGLGLSISKRLVELMGGTIWVESVWGQGTTFGFTLPKERNDV